ncbi:MAG: hypothetical protein A3K83_03155 [Omnitrophica WOR_2 bacterium RBG_13_44_8b]|nr:MAG: hypothetical protein A3K83_03155 [Omnitrophica WOR_2 bacterium RBG_13_44_8b]
MQEGLEKLIKFVYKKWQHDAVNAGSAHPDEQELACFLERKLPEEESTKIKQHLLECDSCLEAFVLSFRLKDVKLREVPEELLSRARQLWEFKEAPSPLEIALKLKERLLEILNVTGDVLVGQELVPAPVLRSRSIKDFKDEVTILKDFKDIRVEVKVENKGAKNFNLGILVKQKDTQAILKDLRVTLLKDDLELESYVTDSGSATFEHVLLGKYRIEISSIEDKLASVLLDIKV